MASQFVSERRSCEINAPAMLPRARGKCSAIRVKSSSVTSVVGMFYGFFGKMNLIVFGWLSLMLLIRHGNCEKIPIGEFLFEKQKLLLYHFFL